MCTWNSNSDTYKSEIFIMRTEGVFQLLGFHHWDQHYLCSDGISVQLFRFNDDMRSWKAALLRSRQCRCHRPRYLNSRAAMRWAFEAACFQTPNHIHALVFFLAGPVSCNKNSRVSCTNFILKGLVVACWCNAFMWLGSKDLDMLSVSVCFRDRLLGD